MLGDLRGAQLLHQARINAKLFRGRHMNLAITHVTAGTRRAVDERQVQLFKSFDGRNYAWRSKLCPRDEALLRAATRCHPLPLRRSDAPVQRVPCPFHRRFPASKNESI
ncbi:hypothetical protein B0H16DRAFT_1461723 [Mycena metata]|uniref:Uncharacterized protein n=1 Tax=Mycena metata TaxID=1033252 RepID=A0AAD7IPX9_9AGAR|nr:hypothetical protein B0H16DRAFT_1461723 [Mycena metata]